MVRFAVLCILVPAMFAGCASTTEYRRIGDTDVEVYRLEKRRRNGDRVVITEYVAPVTGNDTCSTTVRETTVTDPFDEVRERTIERIRCGITESRIVERPGSDGRHTVRELALDGDHDGNIEHLVQVDK